MYGPGARTTYSKSNITQYSFLVDLVDLRETRWTIFVGLNHPRCRGIGPTCSLNVRVMECSFRTAPAAVDLVHKHGVE